MSDDEMRNKIGEACPEVCVWRTDIMEWVWLSETTKVFDPLNDLNAMHAAYLTLSDDQRWMFRTNLTLALQRSPGPEGPWYEGATARQRAEAFIATVCP